MTLNEQIENFLSILSFYLKSKNKKICLIQKTDGLWYVIEDGMDNIIIQGGEKEDVIKKAIIILLLQI